jgi:hypothetical protein
MHSETAIESRATARGRRRKRGNGPADGPVFVDNSGRRAKMLRRVGLLLGVVCLGYATVLVAAFMGWGTSINPSSLLPFGHEARSGQGPGSFRPGGGPGNGLRRTGATPSALPTGAATLPAVTSSAATSSASASAAD